MFKFLKRNKTTDVDEKEWNALSHIKRQPQDNWLKEKTFHHSAFSDIKALVKKKEESNTTISLCIPALNEEKTIGKEIVLFKSELIMHYPLLDEIIVIDSGSEDKTVETAREFGATVFLASEILSQYGNYKGKGENLWKAIYVTKGDIIVYIDADITNIHPRFVYGLLGPLLNDPEIKYVKAFYERPIAYAKNKHHPAGGGRVTEILVRPLLSLFFPELAAIIQPLSGEYAARRDVLEQIPFPVGYGIETAHLIDIYLKWGIEAFAQTDLDARFHRNQDIYALGRMGFAIIQTFLHRLSIAGANIPNNYMSAVLYQFESSYENYQLIKHTIQEIERPPMLTIQEYLKKRTSEQ